MEHEESGWDQLMEAAINQLLQRNGNWAALTATEQKLAALWKLQADMYNGGFVQFFCNWGYDVYTLALRGLDTMQATETARILRRAYQVIARFEKDERLEQLWDLPRFLTQEECQTLDAVDQAFWADPDQLAVRGYRQYGPPADHS